MKNLKLLLGIAVVVGMTYSCSWEKDSEKALDKNGKELRTVHPSEEREARIETNLEKAEPKAIKINLFSKSGSIVMGTVEFKQEGTEVFMVADINGLTPGEHAIHIHENADCSSKDGKSAGGHWNPTNKQHGKWKAKAGYHRGDIGNFTANEDGEGTVKFSTDEWCVACDDKDKNIIGKSVVIHEGADDFTSQPAGNAGKRVACGEIAQYK